MTTITRLDADRKRGQQPVASSGTTRAREWLRDAAGHFHWHSRTCAACARVDLDRPATIAACCYEGARLLREVFAAARKAVEGERASR